MPFGPTIFDAARRKGYLCLAVLERGDAMPVLQEMDAVLYLGDNALHGAEPIPGFRENVPAGLRALFQEWRDRFAGYTCACRAYPATQATTPGDWMRPRTSSSTSRASLFSCWSMWARWTVKDKLPVIGLENHILNP